MHKLYPKLISVEQVLPPILLSLGLVFSVATQLHIPGLGLGLGEVLLILWLLSTLVSTQSWRNPVLSGLLSLVAVGIALLSAGYFLTTYPAEHARPSAMHDMLAYAFSAVLAINYARLARRYEDSLPVALLWAFLLSVLLALVLGVIAKDWSGMDAIYNNVRWQQLSNNPNQCALLALALPFLALFLILRQHQKQNLLLLIPAYLLSLGVGFYTLSDALTLAWLFGGAVVGLALLMRRLQAPAPSQAQQSAVPHTLRITAVLIMLMVAVSAWQWRGVAIAMVSDKKMDGGITMVAGPGDDKQQVRDRLKLWRNSLAVIKYAPLTGMGPGAHSGLKDPFEGVEAHNTLLDWGTQTGLPGMAALAAYFIWVFWRVARRRQYELTAMLIALYCFAMFHDVLRQPLFWIIPLLAWSLAEFDMRGRTSADGLGQPIMRG